MAIGCCRDISTALYDSVRQSPIWGLKRKTTDSSPQSVLGYLRVRFFEHVAYARPHPKCFHPILHLTHASFWKQRSSPCVAQDHAQRGVGRKSLASSPQPVSGRLWV